MIPASFFLLIPSSFYNIIWRRRKVASFRFAQSLPNSRDTTPFLGLTGQIAYIRQDLALTV
jgi:hypothetical protein